MTRVSTSFNLEADENQHMVNAALVGQEQKDIKQKLQKLESFVNMDATQLIEVATEVIESRDVKLKIFSSSSSSASVSKFILLGFSCTWDIQILLISIFSGTYISTLIGNLCIICAVRCDHRLQTPMYILLANFSFLEMCYINSTVPSMLANFFSEKKTISFSGCFLQFYFFFSMGTTETFFLSAMAFDRYLAICRPLHYTTIMTVQKCFRMGACCWVCGFLCFLLPVYLISQLPFCCDNKIDHFLCDPGPLIKLSCSPAPTTEMICALYNSVLIFSTFLFITSSYTLVIRTVLRVPSAEGRRKTFSTCGSHLAVVSLFYGSIMIVYVSPTSGNPAGMQKIVTLFYSVLTPLVNPLIYSLRNKEMKEVLKKLLRTVRQIHGKKF
ncbi:olfactory receptor 11H6 [Heterocephalus glaber]|uniref:Olfactory receptor n=2 Tax=Heterocephalus glaber TaxID=10181 RepID=A0AAX6RVL5_HETGA|nr:olfactory receptor 11H6 [Heterocephalus glaber]